MWDGTTVNRRYHIDRVVGEGGMATVHLAHDLLLDRDVAIKILHARYASDASFRARFEREAQSAAGFTHPNIVDIFDVGEERGIPYIVMEYIHGDTLKEIIDQEGPFHPDDVAALLTQVGSALDYAHERGFVHRDIKPQNILVDEQGRAKVVDFGIAKGLADAHLTEIGTGLGTVHYLSPEQASGLMATPASDIYSLGVVSFEMLTRELPFDADSSVAVAMRHIHDPPPKPSDVMPDLPAAIDDLVVRALQKDPTRRYSGAGAFATAFTDWRSFASSGSGDRPRVASLLAPSSRSRTALAPAVTPPSRNSDPMPQQVAGLDAARASRPSEQSDGIGCSTWIVGVLILVSLVALILIGFRLSQRLTNSDAEPSPTSAAALAAPTVAPVASDEPVQETVAESTVPASLGVPTLIGMTPDNATTAANSRGFQLVVSESVFSETVAEGQVAEQDSPPDADLAQGETISVKLSRGSARIDLGALDLVGKPFADVSKALQERGFAIESEQVGSHSVPEGSVVAVLPDTAEVGQTVTLQVSAGDRIEVPGSIQGQPLDQAVSRLVELGFVVGDRVGVARATIEGAGLDLATGGIADGDVVGIQGDSVDFGAWVPPGSSVTLVYYDAGLDNQ